MISSWLKDTRIDSVVICFLSYETVLAWQLDVSDKKNKDMKVLCVI